MNDSIVTTNRIDQAQQAMIRRDAIQRAAMLQQSQEVMNMIAQAEQNHLNLPNQGNTSSVGSIPAAFPRMMVPQPHHPMPEFGGVPRAQLIQTDTGVIAFARPPGPGGEGEDQEQNPCEGLDFDKEVRDRIPRLMGEDAADREAASAELEKLVERCPSQMNAALKALLGDDTLPQDPELRSRLNSLVHRAGSAPLRRLLVGLLEGGLETVKDPDGNTDSLLLMGIACEWRGPLLVAQISNLCSALVSKALAEIEDICAYSDETDPRRKVGLQQKARQASTRLKEMLPNLLGCLK